MKTIEINTAQNVFIEYQLASFGQRFGAFILDLIFLTVISLILSAFREAFNTDFGNGFLLLLIVLVSSFYSLISEVLGKGQTLGKKILGIKVIKTNGKEMEFYDYFSRWSLRLIDIYLSFGMVATLMVISGKKSQRLGDVLGNTCLIVSNQFNGFSLKEIQKLNQKKLEDFELKYPLANKLSDEDVIVLKKLIQRNKTYNNQAHHEAFNMAVHRLVEILELNQTPKNKEEFINNVISEYILLTR